MREKHRKLRWDEASGEMRLDDVPVARRTSWGKGRWNVALMLGAVLAGVAWWFGKPLVEPGWAPVGPVLEGQVSEVIDGDSLMVELSSGPIEVRMHSIDAPEWDQPGGREAREALERRLRGKRVTLEPVKQDRYERMVAIVSLGDVNVEEWMVQEGHAWVYRQFARDPRYCEAEMAARQERRGVWVLPQAEQRAPWEWRAVHEHRRAEYTDYSGETLERCVAALGKEPADAAPLPLAEVPVPAKSKAASGECRIKGNISGSGRIYHVPGSPAYEKTKIDETRGERWFCTEKEAKDAGWRAPRG